MFARCQPRVRVATVRLDIRTTVHNVLTSHLHRLVVLLGLLTQTSRKVDTCVNLVGPTYKCRYCGSEFTDRHQMLHHVKTMHHGRRFVCPQCQRSYVAKDGLKQHVDGMHRKLYTYRCETCGKGFFGRSVYHDHIAAHTGVKRHTCSICEMKFLTKSTLKKTCFTFSSDGGGKYF